MLTRALSLTDKIKYFGDPFYFLDSEGLITPAWKANILASIPLPSPLRLTWAKDIYVSRISCHKLIAPFLEKALLEIKQIPEVWGTINDYGGCYNFRLQRKSKDTLSSHSWAIAIDLDVADNPFGRNPKVHPVTREVFANNGFIWGGLFGANRKDGMHFEFADPDRLDKAKVQAFLMTLKG